MKQILIACTLCLSAPPLVAEDGTQNEPPGTGQLEDGFNLLREGSRLFLEHLFEELEPTLKEFEGFVLDLNAYQKPEILPNGDIIIRRKPDAPDYVPPEKQVEPDSGPEIGPDNEADPETAPDEMGEIEL